ncbi:hypothetical protein EVAR_86897_1 [Eumeta japonica]|uniref:Uncharacterized protein n=1 Tax=Eumeta variegata TaxID=151549 RepID=A0A4C1W927_EUMVA|nr:hypothetical protein EVAR_86897_1 [Eumeta japonica]
MHPRTITRSRCRANGKRSGPQPPPVHGSTIQQRLDGPSSQQPWMLLSPERALTVEMVESVDSCDRLDGIVETYTECINKHAKFLSLETRSPSRQGYVVGEYVQAKEVYGAAAAEAQTASWAVLLCTGRGEPVGRHLQGHQGNREKPGGYPTKTDSGLVLSPNESATLWRNLLP